MKTTLAVLSLAAVSTLGLVSGLRAQEIAAPSTSDNLAHVDRSFVLNAAQASTNEYALSDAVAMRTSNPEVKAFAEDMKSAHRQLNEDLQNLAIQDKVDISGKVDKGRNDGVSDLASESGTDLDRAYVKDMVKGHEAAVKLFEKESTDGKDPAVTALAGKYLPIVRQHLEHAKSLQESIEK